VAATDIHLVDQTEIERIERWRAEELERAGYEPRAAGRLAVRHDVDLHAATRLLESGCPPDLALKILL
jgi:succinylglutamate desuccinylase